MKTVAVVLEKPEQLALKQIDLAAVSPDDIVVKAEWSGISSGTERLLWTGRMPHFPGMGYPLVPGYETVGRVVTAGDNSTLRAGDEVFVPGANCYGEIKGLFGGAASTIVLPARRAVPLPRGLGETGILFALAATAHHAVAGPNATCPDLIVGHGILGRLIARIALALGQAAPTVWERNPLRREAAGAYPVITPDDDPRRDYGAICDASGDAALLDTLIARLRKGGEITLAGFYETPISFAFPPAFMREARLRIAAEWTPDDIAAVRRLIDTGRLDLSGLITNRAAAGDANNAYRTAFADPACLKMILDWRTIQ
jgi:bacteriochlorophyllide a dehydrogenase